MKLEGILSRAKFTGIITAIDEIAAAGQEQPTGIDQVIVVKVRTKVMGLMVLRGIGAVLGGRELAA